jgi:zinc/manganese transport system substrate-binding protein
MTFKHLVYSLFFVFSFLTLQAKELKVVCSTSDLAWLAKKIGKEHVTVVALSDGNDDAHYMDATPKSVKLVSDADLLCFIGLELEIGWLPKVIQKSGNLKVKPEQIGSCDCSVYVDKLDKVNGPVDRSMGDLHPFGNPHYQLDPHQYLKAGKSILESLTKIRPEQKEFFTKNFETLSSEIEALVVKLKEKIKTVGKIKVTQYHKEYTYLINFFELSSFESIEKVPGVSPSAERLYSFGLDCKKNEVKCCLATINSPQNKLVKFNSISQIPYIREKISLINFNDDLAYQNFMEELTDKLVKSQSPKK